MFELMEIRLVIQTGTQYQLIMGGEAQRIADSSYLSILKYRPIVVVDPLASFSEIIDSVYQQGKERSEIGKDIEKEKEKLKYKEFKIHFGEKCQKIDQYNGPIQIFKGEIKIFEGVMSNKKRQGFGILYSQNKAIIYQGNFKNDMFEGEGWTPNYQGQFSQGKYKGWGIYKDSKEQIIYTGYFKQNLFQDVGYLNVSGAEVISFLKQNEFCQQKICYKYVGEWKEGLMEGRGKLTTKSQIYTGNFCKGLFDGEGKLKTTHTNLQGKFVSGSFV